MPPTSKPGWIYILYDGQYTKIGLTTGEVEARSKQLQTGNPRIIHTVYKFRVDDVHTVEKRLHHHFKHKHVRGEWFDLSDRDLWFIFGEYPNGKHWTNFKTRWALAKLWFSALYDLIRR